MVPPHDSSGRAETAALVHLGGGLRLSQWYTHFRLRKVAWSQRYHEVVTSRDGWISVSSGGLSWVPFPC